MKKGFTLVELLIVIAIISILAAIAIPQFSKYKKRAYVAAMKSDAHNIIAAEEAYFAEHDDYVDPTTSNLGITLSNNVNIVTHGHVNATTCGSTPGYYFVLKHSNIPGGPYVAYCSCNSTKNAPYETNSTSISCP
jgi:type IV pilus assembly protein PilA